jgi:hypothetical protein
VADVVGWLLWVHDNSNVEIFVLAAAAFLFSATKELPVVIGFRIRSLRKALDQFIVQRCSGNPRLHRVTLFAKAPGIWVVLVGMTRLFRSRFGTPEKWRALWRVKWFHPYLYVYARASGSRSPLSSAAFRVSDTADECEGIAGQCWEQGFCIAYDLPKLTVDELRAVTDLESLPEIHPVRKYAEETYTRSIAQLHATNHPARHFMGVIVRVEGKEWGVLLLDSEADTRPFPNVGYKENGGVFGKSFKEFAAVLSHFLT